MDKDYHETFDRYQPRLRDFHDVVTGVIPADWSLHRGSLWFQCRVPGFALPIQGWKIHVSATPANACETLKRVVGILVARGDAEFKFALDLSALALINGKNWSRGGSGKFITIYPRDNDSFISLVEELYLATLDLSGPYILSDHAYKSSSVLFYRYGGITLKSVLNFRGEKIPVLMAPDGSTVPDKRCAFPSTPSWIQSPFSDVHGQENSSSTNETAMLKGRYAVQSVLHFSNAGGIYLATDQTTGARVLVKEARPHISGASSGSDAVELLKKEFRLLSVVADLQIAPQPVDLFREWDHWFLVEEFIEGDCLSTYSAQHSLLLRTRPSTDDLARWHASFRSLCLGLIELLEKLHSRKIVFSDLSPNNVLMAPGSRPVLVDFEGAYQLGVDRPTTIFTPGFASSKRRHGGEGSFAEDYYGLGSVLLACLLPLNQLFHLSPEAKTIFLENVQSDLSLPQSVINLILDLTCENEQQRPSLSQMRSTLDKAIVQPSGSRPPALKAQGPDWQSLIKSIALHIEATANFSRGDRLFPADPKVFTTNPNSLSHGAAGVTYALYRLTGRVPESAVRWILAHKLICDDYPPGLFMGLAGIAWVLLELGYRAEAENIFHMSESHPALNETADLFYGHAGWGMTCLRFFMETQDQLYLECALRTGDTVLEKCVDATGDWKSTGNQNLGLAHGSSGIALFLLYLYMVTGQDRFLNAGRKGLEFDLDFAIPTCDGGLSWASSTGARSPLFPYWQMGSAGIGQVLLRYYRLSSQDRYRAILEKIFIDTDRKYAVHPGRFTGLAGIGDFLLDMYDVFADPKYLRSAEKAADGISLFRVERSGTAFPGNALQRLTCDYGTGSSGIALFLHRLVTGNGADFMLDSLFSSGRCAAPVKHSYADIACSS